MRRSPLTLILHFKIKVHSNSGQSLKSQPSKQIYTKQEDTLEFDADTQFKKTPTAAGTTTEALLRSLPAVYMLFCQCDGVTES